MKKLIWTLPLLIAMPLLAWSQTSQGPDTGQESYRIKSLSETEVQAYLNGRGMGLAKPAELNSYPGPMHVLELAEKLQLSARQKGDTQEAFERMRGEAIRLGKLIVEKEAKLNDLFAKGKAGQKDMQTNIREIARLQGELRAVHLSAHLETRRVLSSDQVEKYNELRGYGKNEVIHRHEQ
ncbi:MAG: hypothetical protein WBD22_14265 [Pyrinomonadaceae bacterium]